MNGLHVHVALHLCLVGIAVRRGELDTSVVGCLCVGGDECCYELAVVACWIYYDVEGLRTVYIGILGNLGSSLVLAFPYWYLSLLCCNNIVLDVCDVGVLLAISTLGDEEVAKLECAVLVACQRQRCLAAVGILDAVPYRFVLA